MGFSCIYMDFHVFQPEMKVDKIKYEGKKGWGGVVWVLYDD